MTTNEFSGIPLRSEHFQRQLRRCVPGTRHLRTAFLGGSVVDGFGNATSDIDILVLVDAPLSEADLTETHYLHRVPVDDYEVLVSEIGGRRIDTEVRQSARYEEVAATLGAFAGQKSPDFYLSVEWLQFLHSLKIALPLVDPERLAGMQGAFPWPALSRYLVARAEEQANNDIEDAAGAIRARDGGTALFASRAALQSAVDAVMAAHGETNPKPKWRVRKLGRLGLTALRDRYLDLETDPSREDSVLIDRSRERLLAAQELLAQAHQVLRDAGGPPGTSRCSA